MIRRAKSGYRHHRIPLQLVTEDSLVLNVSSKETKSMRTTLACLFLALVGATSACDERRGPPGIQRPRPEKETYRPRNPRAQPRKPDLVITHGARSPAGVVRSGTTCRFTFHVQNRGLMAITGAVVVSGPGGRSGSVTGLAIGESKKVTINYPMYGSGTRRLCFEVDPDNVIDEVKEGNNHSQTFVITSVQ